MTLPLTSPFTAQTAVTKAQLDQLVASINKLNSQNATGTQTGTTDASGYATINHTLGAVPSFVTAVSTQGGNTLANIIVPWAYDTLTSTTFRIRFLHASTISGSDWLVNLALTAAYSIQWTVRA